jgi:hypothetical protein
LERPLSSPKGAAYRHDRDVDLQPADSIKFRFSGNAGPALLRSYSSRQHRAAGESATAGRRNRPARHCGGPQRTDIDDIVQLFHVFNEATHGSAGKHGFARLQSIRQRVEGGIMFLAAVAL